MPQEILQKPVNVRKAVSALLENLDDAHIVAIVHTLYLSMNPRAQMVAFTLMENSHLSRIESDEEYDDMFEAFQLQLAENESLSPDHP